ncbi:putative U1 small nuclear ribonucleoprotein C [Cryptosporidium felis]|nr:putative U1 small nuclear ribonucleoprotein C [Cryptosporidium felis]
MQEGGRPRTALMGRHEKVIGKHYCEVCKIWIENHPINLRSHQEGGRHRYNLRKQLRSESLIEAQKKRNEEEIRKEFLKLQGITERPDRERRTLKRIEKSRNVPVFSFNCAASRTRTDDQIQGTPEQESPVKKHEAGVIGKWEVVEESDSVFQEARPQPQNSNPFAHGESRVQIKNSSISRNICSVSSRFYDFPNESFHGRESHDEKEASGEKTKIEFKFRKAPAQSRRS